MARAVWTGAVSFGLVNVPVKAYTAVRDHEVHFHQLEKGTGARIRNQKVSDRSGDEVDRDEIEMGYEVSKGHYVTIDPDELAAMRPQTTRTIDVSDFVDLADIDPIYYERTYWLAPDGEAATKAYRLLQEAMQDEGKVGVGDVVMRNKQYLAAVRPLDGALALSTMRFADEVVPQADVEALPGKRKGDKPAKQEMALAKQIIDALATEWDPEKYHDTYTDELKDLLHRKAEGEEIVVEEAPAAEAKVLDLMAALEASVSAAKKGRTAKGSKAKDGTAKDGTAKSGTAKKSSGTSGKGSKGTTRTAKRTGKRTSKRTARRPAERAGGKTTEAGRSAAKRANGASTRKSA